MFELKATDESVTFNIGVKWVRVESKNQMGGGRHGIFVESGKTPVSLGKRCK